MADIFTKTVIRWRQYQKQRNLVAINKISPFHDITLSEGKTFCEEDTRRSRRALDRGLSVEVVAWMVTGLYFFLVRDQAAAAAVCSAAQPQPALHGKSRSKNRRPTTPLLLLLPAKRRPRIIALFLRSRFFISIAAIGERRKERDRNWNV